jgi:hypothetical protein
MTESADIEDAEPAYSQYAVKSILVENGVTLPELEKILFEFAGSKSILTEHEVRSLVLKGLGDKERVDYAISHLIGLAFLGVEIRENEFEFIEDYGEVKKSSILARRLTSGRTPGQRFKVNQVASGDLDDSASCLPLTETCHGPSRGYLTCSPHLKGRWKRESAR